MPKQLVADVFILALTELRDVVRAERKARINATIRTHVIRLVQDLRAEFTDGPGIAALQPIRRKPWQGPPLRLGRE